MRESAHTQVKRAAAEGLRIVDACQSSSCAQGFPLQLGNEVCEPPASALGAPAEAPRVQGAGMPDGRSPAPRPTDTATRLNAGGSGARDGGGRESKGDMGAWTGMTDEQRLAALSQTRMALRQRARHGKA